MDIYSPWTDFVCSFPSDVCLFKEVFGASSVEKGQKHHIMECYLVWKPANRLPFRIQEKVEMMNVLTSTVLSHFHIASVLLSLKSILPPFWEKRLKMKMLGKNTYVSLLGFQGIKPKQQNGNVTWNKKKKSNIPMESQSFPYCPSLLFYLRRSPQPPFIFHIQIGCNA